MAIQKEIQATAYVDGTESPLFPESGYFAIRESVDFLVPQASLIFKDHIGTFVAMYPFLQDTKIDIALDDGELNKLISFYAFSDQKQQDQDSIYETYNFNLDLIHESAHPLMTEGEFHSKTCKASEYVKYIADKLGLGFDIEDTLEIAPIINPNWRYTQMLRFLATRSKSVNGSSGYLYFVNSNKELVFKTIDKMFEQASREEILVLLDDDAQENSVVNRDVSLKGNYFSNIILGSNNTKTRFYDWKTSSYKELEDKYNDSLKKRGIKKGISQAFSETGHPKYFGEYYTTDKEHPSIINTSTFKKTLLQAEMFQMEILMPVDLERKLGDIVDVTVTAREEMEIGEIEPNYSGRYMIKNMMTYGHSEYYQRLLLIRPGMNLGDSRTGYY